MFTGKATDTGVVTDSINTTMPEPEGYGLMPEPEGYGLHNKYAEMEDNLVRGDGYTAINELGEGESQNEEDNVYSESEMDRIDKEKAQKKREEQQMAALQQQLRESRQHINAYDNHYTEQQMAALQQQLRESRQHINAYDDHYTGSYSSGGQQRDMERFEEEMRQIQERSRKMARDITGDDYPSRNGQQAQPYPNGQITGYDIYGNPIMANQQPTWRTNSQRKTP